MCGGYFESKVKKQLALLSCILVIVILMPLSNALNFKMQNRDTSPKSVADVVDVYRSSPLDHQSDVDTLVEAHQPNSPSVLDNSTDVPRRGDEKSVLLPV